ncbi:MULTISPECIES: carboxylate--amine ligase [Salinibaculum]|uniref:carboxylate--amine ligase n=1 Tax=Salinibaculum TaxID=2732368 RepID=UPI0030D47D03
MTETRGGTDTVVIPTGYDPGSYSAVRSLARRGVRTIVASHYDDVPAAASRYCDEAVDVPDPDDDLVAYRDALLSLARRPSVRTILPLRPFDPYVFARDAASFDRHVSLVTPPADTLDTVFDRVQLFEAAADAGVPIPETRRLADGADWPTPRIVKSRYNLLTSTYCPERAPEDAETVKSVEHVPSSETIDVEAVRDRMGHDPIVQEFVASSGQYVFGALYDHGEPLATFQHRQLRGDSYTGGGGVYRESIDDPELEAVGRALLDHLDWHGLACIEYMKDETTGEYKLAEINPRLWQSLPCAVRAGADFPWYYWQAATGRADDIDPEYQVGVRTHLLHGELGYLQSIRADGSPFYETPSLSRATVDVARSCLTDPHFDTLRLDDPRPFLRGVRHVISK